VTTLKVVMHWINILMSSGAQFLNRNDPPPKGTCEHTWKRSGFGIGFHEANGIEREQVPRVEQEKSTISKQIGT